jgi:hypothetical protein
MEGRKKNAKAACKSPRNRLKMFVRISGYSSYCSLVSKVIDKILQLASPKNNSSFFVEFLTSQSSGINIIGVHLSKYSISIRKLKTIFDFLFKIIIFNFYFNSFIQNSIS